MPISLVIFDMDDVLCHYDVPRRIAGLHAATGVAEAAIQHAIWGSDYFDKADSGVWSADACLAEFATRIGAPLTRAQWVATRRAAMTPFSDMLELIARLKAEGRSVALLTNNDLLAKETLGELFPGLPALFAPHAYVSAELGLQKPDPAIFREVCRRVGVPVWQALFTDDLAENVAGAREAGLAGHRFAGRAGLEAAIREGDEAAPGAGLASAAHRLD